MIHNENKKIENTDPQNKKTTNIKITEEKENINTEIDLLSAYRKQLKLKRIEVKKERSKIDDNVFINVLKKQPQQQKLQLKSQNTNKNILKHSKNKIYRNACVISTTELTIHPIKYYKFPFDTDFPKESTFWFNKMYKEWHTAIKNVYTNYIQHKTHFHILFLNSLITFQNGYANCCLSLSNLLKNNDINFTISNNTIKVVSVDVALLFDLIINYDLRKNDFLPFVLSNSEFENSIMYFTRVSKGVAVLNKGITHVCYKLDGYFYGEDYAYILEQENVIFNT
ncbi:hypothetical protein EDEG_02180 [Edhazardia aedis USNM 41457]|uniref:Uncharacterized protein n=1 Tax=Edhazardia aedis (strain USNM 41457) TaxID=1003232 RepID=J9D7I7_EDHAE|nr:hypothetical protein EDEG_02180 [Edhazardia aedis USNM 41457]|eukprot:EJW03484.1 hypothetical protein EDEG_02180 [Edhazardia aedis USNM 41457]